MEFSLGRVSSPETARNVAEQQRGPEKNQSSSKQKEEQKGKLKRQVMESLVSADSEETWRHFKEILRFTEIFNKKLKYSIAEGSNQVVVKVVDRETDEIIKEIPPKELRRLYESMREAVGLLVDRRS